LAIHDITGFSVTEFAIQVFVEAIHYNIINVNVFCFGMLMKWHHVTELVWLIGSVQQL
ncbi:hypothetical protein ACJX0J_018359, partial [Zea mays]